MAKVFSGNLKNLYLVLASILLVTGCDSTIEYGSNQFSLSTDKHTYQSGKSVSLTLKNQSRRSITIHPNLCGNVLQLKTEQGWQPEFHEGNCTLIAMDLRSGREIVIERDLEDSKPGEYRLKYSFTAWEHTSTDQFVVFTERFTIE